jgi:hypothetical protein
MNQLVLHGLVPGDFIFVEDNRANIGVFFSVTFDGIPHATDLLGPGAKRMLSHTQPKQTGHFYSPSNDVIE